MVFMVPALMLGCESFNMKKEFPWAKDEEIPEKRVSKLVSSWSETALAKPGQSPQRGFGGRMYFLDGQGKAIQVDGELVIYGYENPAGRACDGPPDRRFVFTSEQLAVHYSESSVGPSYSVWVPWDQIGGDQKHVDLVPTFVPKLGQVVVGSQSRMRLPGRQTPAKKGRTLNTGQDGRPFSNAAIAPVDYHQATDALDAANAQINASPTGLPNSTVQTTLRVPPSLQKRMRMTAASSPLRSPTRSASQLRLTQSSTHQGSGDSRQRANAYQQDMESIEAANDTQAQDGRDPRAPSSLWANRQAVGAPMPPAQQPSGHSGLARHPAPTAPIAQQPNDPPAFRPFHSRRPQFPAPFQSWTRSKAPPQFGSVASSTNVPSSR
jgi:hypothetical protein